MAGDSVGPLPDDLDEWIESKASAEGVDEGTVLARAVLAYREVEALSDGDLDGDPDLDDALADPEPLREAVDELESRVDSLESATEDVESVEQRVAALDDEMRTLIEDVRERVVQVKRETDAKAPADHDHPEVADAAESARDRAADLADRVDDVAARVDEGFDNFEEILEYLTDTTDELVDRADDLDDRVDDLDDRVAALEAREHERRTLDEIRTAANRNGDAMATCDACRSTVRIGLLSEPRCPHCEASFADVEPSSGFFGLGVATLTTGDPPALESGTRGAAEDPHTEGNDD